MPALLRKEFRQNRRHRVEDALDIDVDHGHPVVDLAFGHAAAGHDPGVGEQHVHLAEPLLGKRCERLHVVQAGDVGCQISRVFADLRSELLQSVFAPCAEHDLRAVRRKDLCCRRPDPGGCPGNQDHLILYVLHIAASCCIKAPGR